MPRSGHRSNAASERSRSARSRSSAGDDRWSESAAAAGARHADSRRGEKEYSKREPGRGARDPPGYDYYPWNRDREGREVCKRPAAAAGSSRKARNNQRAPSPKTQFRRDCTEVERLQTSMARLKVFSNEAECPQCGKRTYVDCRDCRGCHRRFEGSERIVDYVTAYRTRSISLVYALEMWHKWKPDGPLGQAANLRHGLEFKLDMRTSANDAQRLVVGTTQRDAGEPAVQVPAPPMPAAPPPTAPVQSVPAAARPSPEDGKVEETVRPESPSACKEAPPQMSPPRECEPLPAPARAVLANEIRLATQALEAARAANFDAGTVALLERELAKKKAYLDSAKPSKDRIAAAKKTEYQMKKAALAATAATRVLVLQIEALNAQLTASLAKEEEAHVRHRAAAATVTSMEKDKALSASTERSHLIEQTKILVDNLHAEGDQDYLPMNVQLALKRVSAMIMEFMNTAAASPSEVDSPESGMDERQSPTEDWKQARIDKPWTKAAPATDGGARTSVPAAAAAAAGAEVGAPVAPGPPAVESSPADSEATHPMEDVFDGAQGKDMVAAGEDVEVLPKGSGTLVVAEAEATENGEPPAKLAKVDRAMDS
jgi:hypothetical protein